MKIFNSLTGKKETFKPKIKREVSIYICGLTPYDDVHIGHARTFINFDVIVKFLRFVGFKVKYVRNITDVDDKIINRAKEEGISAFIKNETKGEKISLEPGPMKPFLMELNRLQREFTLEECPIRTALVTARSAPTHKRVIKTLREWGVRIDESLFLGGMSKEDFLKSFQADIFFDDQLKNIQDASGKITSAHVPYGVKNEVK